MEILIYTGNQGKIQEFKEILAIPSFKFQYASELNIDTGVEETGSTFVENAIIKARDGARQANMPCIADDSGIMVDCLGGQPGVFSARYAGIGAKNSINIEKLLKDLSDFPPNQRTARFVCCIVYLRSYIDPCPIICLATMEGLITEKPSGQNGFGYDPVFYLPEYQKTAAEIPPSLKHSISHRGKALNKLKNKLTKTLTD
ncbi:MAG: RdgB/HAM1 family non-canonical purine NTP pyrophosphatase [Pseudomonadota bacterium]|nr:RdgB/HAM1 family non-canonical purine NTP pyrophosphatase [Pseudomonadota bacterium]